VRERKKSKNCALLTEKERERESTGLIHIMLKINGFGDIFPQI
jgi:hypothetical protein